MLSALDGHYLDLVQYLCMGYIKFKMMELLSGCWKVSWNWCWTSLLDTAFCSRLFCTLESFWFDEAASDLAAGAVDSHLHF